MELVSAFIFASVSLSSTETELALDNKKRKLRRKREEKSFRRNPLGSTGDDVSRTSSDETSQESRIQSNMEQILYRRFNNKNLEALISLACFPHFAAYLQKYEYAIMPEFDTDV